MLIRLMHCVISGVNRNVEEDSGRGTPLPLYMLSYQNPFSFESESIMADVVFRYASGN